jgi:hypothetical protein
MKPPDPVMIAAGIVIAAFAIDRFVSAFLFLISYRWKWADPVSIEGTGHIQAEKTYKLAYFSLAAALALAVFLKGNLSVFAALGFQRSELLDAIITTLVIVGGTDRVAALLNGPSLDKTHQPESQPVRIAGTVTLLTPAEAPLEEAHEKTGISA